MATSSVGTPTSGNGAAATPTSFAVTFPTTPQADDIAVIFGHVSAGTITMSLPAGWAAPSGFTNPVNQSTNSRAYIWWKRLTASEAAPTITNSGNTTGGWSCYIVRGGNTGATPVRATSNSGSGVTTLNLPSLAGVTTGSMLLTATSARVASGTIPSGINPNASYTEGPDHGTSRVTTGQNIRMQATRRGPVSPGGTYGGESMAVANSVSSSMITLLVEVLEQVTGTNLSEDIRHADWVGPEQGVATSAISLASATRHADWAGPGGGVVTAGFGQPNAVRHATPLPNGVALRAGFGQPNDIRDRSNVAPGPTSVTATAGRSAEARSLAPLLGSTPATVSAGIAHVTRALAPLLGTARIDSALSRAAGTVSSAPLLGLTAVRAGFGQPNDVRSLVPLLGVGRIASAVSLGTDARHISTLSGAGRADSSLVSSVTAELRHATAILGLSTAQSALGLVAPIRSLGLLPGAGRVDSGVGRGYDTRHLVPLLGVGRSSVVRPLVFEAVSLAPLVGGVDRITFQFTGDLLHSLRSLGVLLVETAIDVTIHDVAGIVVPPDAIVVDIAPFALNVGDGGVIEIDLTLRTVRGVSLSALIADIGQGGG